jgi:hypothetical protein
MMRKQNTASKLEATEEQGVVNQCEADATADLSISSIDSARRKKQLTTRQRLTVIFLGPLFRSIPSTNPIRQSPECKINRAMSQNKTPSRQTAMKIRI